MTIPPASRPRAGPGDGGRRREQHLQRHLRVKNTETRHHEDSIHASASLAVVGRAVAGLPGIAAASSHREAPAIAEDQFADNTDVYAFISPNDPDKLVIVANYVPLLLPSSGPNFYKFSDDVRYEILLDNDGDAQHDMTYRFIVQDHSRPTASTFLYNVGPIASLDDANLNVRQTYDALQSTRTTGPRSDDRALVDNGPGSRRGTWATAPSPTAATRAVAQSGRGRDAERRLACSPARATSRSSSTSTCSTCSGSAARRPPTAST